MKAKWSPELGQDLNAYHNLDAEVELTGILSEQIALEIDRELLGELVDGAKPVLVTGAVHQVYSLTAPALNSEHALLHLTSLVLLASGMRLSLRQSMT